MLGLLVVVLLQPQTSEFRSLPRTAEIEMRRLETMRSQGRWKDFAEALQKIDTGGAAPLIPDPETPGVFIDFRRYVRRWLRATPTETRAAIETHVDPPALALLKEWTGTRDPELLDRILRDHFLSTATGPALDALAGAALECGDCDLAIRHWRLILEAPRPGFPLVLAAARLGNALRLAGRTRELSELFSLVTRENIRGNVFIGEAEKGLGATIREWALSAETKDSPQERRPVFSIGGDLCLPRGSGAFDVVSFSQDGIIEAVRVGGPEPRRLWHATSVLKNPPGQSEPTVNFPALVPTSSGRILSPQVRERTCETGGVLALRMSNGAICWDTAKALAPLGHLALGAPLSLRGRILIPGLIRATRDSDEPFVAAVDEESGDLIWLSRLSPGLPSGTPPVVTVREWRVVVSTNLGTVACLDAWDGSTIWSAEYERTGQRLKLSPTESWCRVRGMRSNSAPCIEKGAVLVLPLDQEQLLSFDERTGRTIAMPGGFALQMNNAERIAETGSGRIVVQTPHAFLLGDPSSGVCELISPPDINAVDLVNVDRHNVFMTRVDAGGLRFSHFSLKTRTEIDSIYLRTAQGELAKTTRTRAWSFSVRPRD